MAHASISRTGRIAGWLLALVLAACSTAPAPQADARSQQREVLRGHVVAMTQRDELYESFSGLRRNDPMFGAAKDSISAVYRDPVVLDWMIDQLDEDRGAFVQRFGNVIIEGFARANDDAAWKMLRPVGAALGRLDAVQCSAYKAESNGAAGGRGASMTALVRRMQPAELNEFFDGFRLALRAGIERAPLRPAANTAQVAMALATVAGNTMPPGAMTECSAAQIAANAVLGASGDTRSHLLSVMLVSAGLGAQRDLQR
jgi:hypothetical protein